MGGGIEPAVPRQQKRRRGPGARESRFGTAGEADSRGAAAHAGLGWGGGARKPATPGGGAAGRSVTGEVGLRGRGLRFPADRWALPRKSNPLVGRGVADGAVCARGRNTPKPYTRCIHPSTHPSSRVESTSSGSLSKL
jgi:hypothetical protein